MDVSRIVVFRPSTGITRRDLNSKQDYEGWVRSLHNDLYLQLYRIPKAGQLRIRDSGLASWLGVEGVKYCSQAKM